MSEDVGKLENGSVLFPSPPKIAKRISILTGKPPIKRGTIFAPSVEEKQAQMEQNAYSGKSSHLSDMKLEELKKTVAKTASKREKTFEDRIAAEKELLAIESELEIERAKYIPLCTELAAKKEQMKLLQDALEKAKVAVQTIKLQQGSIVRDALNGHGRRVKKNKRQEAAALLATNNATTLPSTNSQVQNNLVNVNLKLATPR